MISARNIKLNNINGSLPNMSDTIVGWFLNITFKSVKRVLEGADWIEEEPTIVHTQGVIQPPSDEDLKILPEGTWAWQWLMLHCLPNVTLAPNDFVIYDDVQYTVMSKKDYSKYGYVQYVLLESYKAGTLSE